MKLLNFSKIKILNMQKTTQVQSKAQNNKAALDQEIEEQLKQLQGNMYALKNDVDVGNVELSQQTGTIHPTILV